MRCRRTSRGWIAASIVLISASASFGCGGWYGPEGLLTNDQLLAMPHVTLERQLRRIPLPAPLPYKIVVAPMVKGRWQYDIPGTSMDGADFTRKCDLAELQDALQAAGMREPASNALIAQYTAVRATLQKHTSDAAAWEALYEFEKKDRPRPSVSPVTVPQGLPAEFDLYMSGAIAWHEQRLADAIAAWKKLLDLPERERKYRSTWAAFMIGKSLLDTDPGGAVHWFEETRVLADDGFADSLGLAADSIGRQAQALFKSGEHEKALEWYMLHRASGADVIQSIRAVCGAIFTASPDATLKAARDPLTRRIVTAFIIARDEWNWGPSGEGYRKQWLVAVEEADMKTMEDADRLAWIAYEAGDMDSARRWLNVSAPGSAAATWLRAKLLLRDNKPDEAAPLLAQVIRLLPTDPDRTGLGEDEAWYKPGNHSDALSPVTALITAEMGAIHLARRDYTEALRTLHDAGYEYEGDANYLAERVLTINELAKYVKERHNMECILRARLVRLGRPEEALQYTSGGDNSLLARYVAALKTGRDDKLPNDERAAALMQAARMVYQHACEFGLSSARYNNWDKIDPNSTWDARRMVVTLPLLKPTEDERWRLLSTYSVHEKNFQSPYFAANIAWEALALMPDNTDNTARAFIEVGGWLKARDPKAADRFYKALVRRCGKTDLGREAERRRWFPKVDAEAPATR